MVPKYQFVSYHNRGFRVTRFSSILVGKQAEADRQMTDRLYRTVQNRSAEGFARWEAAIAADRKTVFGHKQLSGQEKA